MTLTSLEIEKAVLLSILVISGLFFFFADEIPKAQGAGLTFSASTTISLINPAENWTIAGGSSASSVQIGTGDMVVAMQNGDSITVSIGNRNFSLTGYSSGAVITRNTLCYLNTGDQQAILTLTAAQNETITLSTVTCGQYASGRGGPQTPPTYTTVITPPPATTTSTPTTITIIEEPRLPVFSSTPTINELQGAITAIIQRIDFIKNNLTSPNNPALIEQSVQYIGQIQKALGLPSLAPTSSMVPPSGSYQESLFFGSNNDDVTALQNFLRSQGADIYPEGKVTGYFGPLTRGAVERFQERYGIVREGDLEYGFVGPKTRAKINELLGL